MGGHYCQICAVPFNRGRARTAFEPPSAGWGWGQRYQYYEKPRCLVLQKESGCFEDEDGEHIAGPGCALESGYSGHRIAAAEMRGMSRPRYIVKKPEKYLEKANGNGLVVAEGYNQKHGGAAEDSQDQSGDNGQDEDQKNYERRSEYFVTSQTTAPITTEWVDGSLERIRFGIRELVPENFSVWPTEPSDDLSDEPSTGIPIHDACWRIFERVCRSRLGAVDLQGFIALYWREACGHCGFQNLKHDAIVYQLQSSSWLHKVGTEYLAANPYYIPGFTVALLDSFQGGGNTPFSRALATRRSRFEPTTTAAPPDPFSKLPEEIKHMMLYRLTPKDVANLRLASRSFHQLPGRFFRYLIEENMPWFWEVDKLDECNQKYMGSIFSSPRSRTDPNWLKIYQHLRVLQTSMLGVRNRVRIYKVVEEIVARIGRMQMEDPEGKYYLQGKGNRLEWASIFAHRVPSDLNPANVTHGWECPRCVKWKIPRGRDWRVRM